MVSYFFQYDKCYYYFPELAEIIAELRTAVKKRDGTLDKEVISHDDLFDVL